MINKALMCGLFAGAVVAQGFGDDSLLPIQGGLHRMDAIGHRVERWTLPVVGPVVGIARDAAARTFVTIAPTTFAGFDAQGVSLFVQVLSQPVGPLVVTASGQVWLGNPELGPAAQGLRVFDAQGQQVAFYPTAAGVTRLCVDELGVVTTLELETNGQGRLRNYDASSGTLLAERMGASFSTGLAPRRGGGVHVSQVDEPSLSAWRGTHVLTLDQSLQTVAGFSTAPEVLPARIIETYQGDLLVSYPASTSGHPALARWSPMGIRLLQRDLPSGVASMHLDGFGRAILVLADAHAPLGTLTEVHALDEALRTRWSREGDVIRLAGAPRAEGDATGALLAGFTAPSFDFDQDGRANRLEIDRGASPLADFGPPMRIVAAASAVPGASLGLTMEAVESPGQEVFLYWTLNPLGLPLRWVASMDRRSLEASPLDAGRTGLQDPLFAATLGQPGGSELVLLDAFGRFQRTVTIPSSAGLAGIEVQIGAVLVDPMAPLSIAAIAPRATLSIR